MKQSIINGLSIIAITLVVIFIIFACLPFIPNTLAEYIPEPIKSILELIADFGARISHFLP